MFEAEKTTLKDNQKSDNKVQVSIITFSCCNPGVAPLEEQAHRIVKKAIAESGVLAQLDLIPAKTAYYSGAVRRALAKLGADDLQGQMKVPPILIDGEVAFYGVPGIDDVKSALRQAAARKTKEEHASEREPASPHEA